MCELAGQCLTLGNCALGCSELEGEKKQMPYIEGKKKKEAYNTCCSQAVTHPSTGQARRCLTSVIGRELVYSAWYGRRRQNAYKIPSLCSKNNNNKRRDVEAGSDMGQYFDIQYS